MPDSDLPGIEQIVDERISENWNDNEIYKYCCCIEDVNPELPEDIALNRMRSIRESVTLRLETK